MIQVQDVWKAYDGIPALKGISFTVQKGELFAFLGPNGAGKSTTIAILSTLVDVDRGSIYIDQAKLGRENMQIRKSIGIVFQGSVLDKTLNVEQNLQIRCGLYGLYGKQAKDRTATLCDICDLTSFKHQHVQTLSGGQRRKVDIARALISDPAILILDEPTTGLDPKARKMIWYHLTELQKTYGKTLFMTSHYMEEAENADHICLIQKGNIIMDTTQEAIKQHLAKEQLYLYTDVKKNVSQILYQHRITHHIKEHYIQIPVMNFFQFMSILRKCEPYIKRIELHQQRMEDIYLDALKEES